MPSHRASSPSLRVRRAVVATEQEGEAGGGLVRPRVPSPFFQGRQNVAQGRKLRRVQGKGRHALRDGAVGGQHFARLLVVVLTPSHTLTRPVVAVLNKVARPAELTPASRGSARPAHLKRGRTLDVCGQRRQLPPDDVLHHPPMEAAALPCSTERMAGGRREGGGR